MTRHLSATVGMMAVWTTSLAALGSAPRQPLQAPPVSQDLTLTGCVQEGTDAGVYILNNAIGRDEPKNMPRTFRLVSSGEELDFTLHVNHQVTATGRAELKPPPETPPGGRIDPRDLPAFVARSIQSVAERCVGSGN